MQNKNITSYNQNSQRHGYWEIYWENGNLWRKGYYINNVRHGHWEYYYSNGMKKYIIYYAN